MGQILLFRKFSLILEHCLKLSAGEEVLILYDETIGESIRDTLMMAAEALKSRPQAMCYIPSRRIPMKEFGLFAGAWALGEPLPRAAIGAIKEADAAVILGSDMDLVFSERLKAVLKEGKRILYLPYLTTEEMLSRLLPDNEEEIEDLSATSLRCFERLNRAKRARITSHKGTDLRLELGQFQAKSSGGVIERSEGFSGRMMLLPAGQVIRVPDERSANGTVVIDRSIGGHNYAPLHESIRLTVKDGFVTGIEGQDEARRFQRFLEELDDLNLFHLTELGIGTNPRCRFSGVAAPAEDTHSRGSVSIALGCDIHLGGITRAKAHIDCTMWHPTLRLDEEIVVDGGRLTL